jgi:hypothetical protein
MSERVKLTKRDLEVLHDLAAGPDAWVRPMDLGGRDGSDHSYRLSKLSRLGLVDARPRSTWANQRGSKEYRLNDAGRRALQSE